MKFLFFKTFCDTALAARAALGRKTRKSVAAVIKVDADDGRKIDISFDLITVGINLNGVPENKEWHATASSTAAKCFRIVSKADQYPVCTIQRNRKACCKA